MRSTSVITIFCVAVLTLECTNAIGIHWTDYVRPGLQRIAGKSVEFGEEMPHDYQVRRPMNEEEEFVYEEQEHKEAKHEEISEEYVIRKARLLSLLKDLLHDSPTKRSIRKDIFKLNLEKNETW